MTEQTEQTERTEHNEPEMIDLIRKLQKHLVYLEKKIDLLVEASSRKPFGEKRFSKPNHSGGYPRHRDWKDRGNRSSAQPQGQFQGQAQGQSQGGGGPQFSRDKKRPFFQKKRWR